MKLKHKAVIVSVVVLLLQLSGIKWPKSGRPVTWEQFAKEFTDVSIIFVFLVSIASYWIVMKWPGVLKTRKNESMFICLSCKNPQEILETMRECKYCGGKVEPLQRFYERHPELK